MDKKNWFDLMRSFGFSHNEEEFDMILKYYHESHRKYHNINHIKDCLEKCSLNEETRLNHELHLAFWYHDIVYKPFKKNNEQKSVDLATSFIKKQTDDHGMSDRVGNLIMATLHNKEPKIIDEAYMMDIDISILGSNEETYIEYTKNIRKEYRLVPWFIYKKKRVEILEMFLRKDQLYHTEYFKSSLESSYTAISNVPICSKVYRNSNA